MNSINPLGNVPLLDLLWTTGPAADGVLGRIYCGRDPRGRFPRNMVTKFLSFLVEAKIQIMSPAPTPKMGLLFFS